MSKNIENNYKKYLDDNFSKLMDYVDNNESVEELIVYNKIIGSLIGLIDSKNTYKSFQNCKDFVLRYYELTYPKNQLEIIDNALFSNCCLEYIKYALENNIGDETDLKILKKFEESYLKGITLSSDVSLKTVLPIFSKKINEYIKKLDSKEKKLYLK